MPFEIRVSSGPAHLRLHGRSFFVENPRETVLAKINDEYGGSVPWFNHMITKLNTYDAFAELSAQWAQQ